jgi:hypothetical protein
VSAEGCSTDLLTAEFSHSFEPGMSRHAAAWLWRNAMAKQAGPPARSAPEAAFRGIAMGPARLGPLRPETRYRGAVQPLPPSLTAIARRNFDGQTLVRELEEHF